MMKIEDEKLQAAYDDRLKDMSESKTLTRLTSYQDQCYGFIAGLYYADFIDAESFMSFTDQLSLCFSSTLSRITDLNIAESRSILNGLLD